MPRWLNSLVPLQNAAFTSLNDFNIPELKRPSIRRQLAISMSAIKRAAIMIVKGIAGVAAVGFWFWRPTTDTKALVFGVSIIVLLICVAVLSSLDDKFIDKHIKEG